MKKVETPWNILFKCCIIFGISFFLIGIFFLLINKSWAFIFNGILWIILGIMAKAKLSYHEHKLQKLKRVGICYDGTVINILPSPLIRIGSYITSCVQCSYITKESKYLVKSNYFVLLPFDTKESLCAKIYFNSSDLQDFIVELYRADK